MLLKQEPMFACVMEFGDRLENRFDVASIVQQLSEERQMCDAESQTPVHFIDRCIDAKYDWNLWNARKK